MPRLLFLVLHDKSGQTVLAALYEKDAEKEEDALIKQARCQKNLEKRRKIIALERLGGRPGPNTASLAGPK